MSDEVENLIATIASDVEVPAVENIHAKAAARSQRRKIATTVGAFAVVAFLIGGFALWLNDPEPTQLATSTDEATQGGGGEESTTAEDENEDEADLEAQDEPVPTTTTTTRPTTTTTTRPSTAPESTTPSTTAPTSTAPSTTTPSNTAPPSTAVAPSTTIPAETPTGADQYLSLPLEQAGALADLNGTPWRVVVLDGQSQVITFDVVPGRLNFTVADNIVVGVEVEGAPIEPAAGTDQYLLLPLEQAGALADLNGALWRVVVLDGEFLAVTEDFRPGRLNFTVTDNIVVGVEVEGDFE